VDLALLQPLHVRLTLEERLLDALIVQHLVLLGVHHEHAPRLQPPPLDDLIGGEAQGPVLGGHHDPAILGNGVAGRTQPVAVERRADNLAIGEGDRRGTVPRLHEGAVVAVEGLALLVHQLVVLPGLRHHHRHRVREAAPREVEELEDIIECRRVALVWLGYRKELLQVFSEELRFQAALAGTHPVDVAP
jgi:hypothetical protein